MADNQKQDKKRQTRILAASDQNSIFLHGYWAYRLGQIDFMTGVIRRKFSLNPESPHSANVAGLMHAFENINSVLWAFVFKISPRLAAADFLPYRWRELNDPVDRKKIYASRNVLSYIVPRHPEVGEVAMAAKLIGEHLLEKKHTAPFAEITALMKDYGEVNKEFTSFMSTLVDMAGLGEDMKKKLSIGAADIGSQHAA